MKKSVLFLVTLSLILILAGTASADTKQRSVNLVLGQKQAQINDESVTMSAPAQVVNGSTLVPLRFISEAFGCEVQWNGDKQIANVTLVSQTIQVSVGQNYAVINGNKTEVQEPAKLINGSVYVPLRFISENLGSEVIYDKNTRAISINVYKYFNENQDFNMFLPVDWGMDEETTDGVKISANNGSAQGQIGLVDNGEAINTSNFNQFADECFKDYATNNVLNKSFKDNIAVITYKEDGLVNVNAYKLLDNGVYCCVFATPEALFNANIAGQIDILINSLD